VKVYVRYIAICYRPSICHLSSVCRL